MTFLGCLTPILLGCTNESTDFWALLQSSRLHSCIDEAELISPNRPYNFAIERQTDMPQISQQVLKRSYRFFFNRKQMSEQARSRSALVFRRIRRRGEDRPPRGLAGCRCLQTDKSRCVGCVDVCRRSPQAKSTTLSIG